MLRFKAEGLQKVVGQILQGAGSLHAEAAMVAEHLVRSNLLGHDSHGVGMIPKYIENISLGSLKPNMPAKLIKEDGSILVFDGQRGFGQITAHEAMEAAIKKCRETGLVLLALRNTHHIGRVGAYGEQSIRTGLVSVHFVNVVGHGRVAPFGGRDSRLGTNPLCIAMPGTEKNDPILLDMATSKIAVGKARVAMNAGRRLPDNMILDPQGNPTDDPAALFEDPPGSLVALGLHKGYGISLFCELLAGALCGGGTTKPRFGPEGGIVNNMLAFVIDPERLVDRSWLYREIDGIVSHMKTSPSRNPETPVMIAGEPERKNEAERRNRGIPMSEGSWHRILEAGEKVGIRRHTLESFINGGDS